MVVAGVGVGLRVSRVRRREEKAYCTYGAARVRVWVWVWVWVWAAQHYTRSNNFNLGGVKLHNYLYTLYDLFLYLR